MIGGGALATTTGVASTVLQNNSAKMSVAVGANSAGFSSTYNPANPASTNSVSMFTATSGGLVINDNTQAVLTGGSAATGSNMTLNSAGADISQTTPRVLL